MNQLFECDVLLSVEINFSWFNCLPANKCCLTISRLRAAEELLPIKVKTEYIILYKSIANGHIKLHTSNIVILKNFYFTRKYFT